MYSKDDLSSRNVATLKDIAKEIGAKIKSSDNKETIIYAILDAQAEQTAQPTKKRVRISKKEDKVYSVKGKDGENYDVMKNQATGPNLPQETSLFKEETPVTDANAPETPQVEEAPATTEESKTSKKSLPLPRRKLRKQHLQRATALSHCTCRHQAQRQKEQG